MNILFVCAHHDDLELGAGASVAKMSSEGHNVYSLVMTNSGYTGPDNKIIRDEKLAHEEAIAAARVLDYTLLTSDGHTFDIPVSDENIVKILNAVKKYKIDTVFTHWHGDTHPPHVRINTMALHASRRVPRVLGFAPNWYVGQQSFAPNFFVPITEEQWNKKVEALKCYRSEFNRTGEQWIEYFDNQTRNYGIQTGANRAEGFFLYKYLWD
jgi:LmbE family N-acetylglucosaminyl deacetylase